MPPTSPRARPPWRRPGRADRSDVGARRAERLRAERADARRTRTRCAAPTRSSTSRRRCRGDGHACSRHAGAAGVAAPSPSTTATTSARRPRRRASTDAFTIPGFVPEYIRPLFCRGKGPFRWAALSGDPADIAVDRSARARDVRRRPAALPLDSGWRRERVAFQGLPARIFWLGYGERARFGLAINDLVRRGVVSAPIVIGRDHLDTGSVASPEPRNRRACATAATPSPTGLS